jgi:uncharacterized metal-binding protein
MPVLHRGQQCNKEPIMSGESLSELKHLVVLPCSGPCNVGQLANQAAVDLTRAGHGMMFNLPGLAAHRPLFVQAAQEMARNMVVVDGCSVGCARSVVEHLGIPVGTFLVLTDLGIEKSDELVVRPEDLAKVKNALMELAPRVEAGLPAEKPKCLCAEEW